MIKSELQLVLRTIAEGYPYEIVEINRMNEVPVEYLVVVENPYFQEDRGDNPNLVITVNNVKV